jgi:intraflagellar transport protein 52
MDEDSPDSALGGFHFVYPFGCTMMVDSPAIKVLTSGPISYPVNKSICGMYMNDRGGKIICVGSYEMLSDSYIDKEENMMLVVRKKLNFDLKIIFFYQNKFVTHL